jgi:hypothetical protein
VTIASIAVQITKTHTPLRVGAGQMLREMSLQLVKLLCALKEKQHKVVVMGDSHARGCATEVNQLLTIVKCLGL